MTVDIPHGELFAQKNDPPANLFLRRRRISLSRRPFLSRRPVFFPLLISFACRGICFGGSIKTLFNQS
jgi:hypothetical protein